LWTAGLLLALTAPAVLEAQERNRRGRGGPDRGMFRLQGNVMSRGLLGIQLSLGWADTDAQGAEVQGVTSDGPADEAGLREGDIITSLDGQSLLEPLADSDLEERVDSDRSIPSQRLLFLARELEPGEEVVVEYLRDGTMASATVEPRSTWMGLGFDADRMEVVMDQARERAREASERAREVAEQMREQWDDYAWFPEGGSAIAVMGLRASHGISLVTLNPALGRYFDAESGALVTDAEEDNPLGLEAGDVIQAIDGRSIDSAGDVRRILRSYEEGEAMTLTIMRDGGEMRVSGSVEDQARLRRRGGVMRGAPAGPVGRRISARRTAPRRAVFRRTSNRVGRPWRGMSL
jgi:membrane-associated protease RseP (regulator of RpoE activity)